MRHLLVIVVFIVVGCMPVPADKPGPFDAETLAMPIGEQEVKLLAELPDHPFWKVPVTTAQISDLVDKMRSEQDDAAFLINDHFRVVLQHGGDAQTAANGRHIEVNRADYHAAPSRLRLLIKLKTNMDQEELRFPYGAFASSARCKADWATRRN